MGLLTAHDMMKLLWAENRPISSGPHAQINCSFFGAISELTHWGLKVRSRETPAKIVAAAAAAALSAESEVQRKGIFEQVSDFLL